MITIDDKQIKTVLGSFSRELQRPRALNAKAARHMRDYIRQTISMQGRPTPWQPLSALYKRRTGKFKAMLSIRDRIKASADNQGGYVYYTGDNELLKQLIKGWRQAAFEMPYEINRKGKKVRKVMAITEMARGAKDLYFSKRQGFRVPARPIWPKAREAQAEVRMVVDKHFNDFVRKLRK